MRGGRKNKKNSEKEKKFYMISAVSAMYNIHPQTLRLYEREGLLKPSRTEGNTRIYTEEDLKKLELILNLSREMGVNLAGIEIILNMREKMEKVQEEVNLLLEYIKNEFFSGKEEEFNKKKDAIVRSVSAKIIKKEDSFGK